MAKKQKLERHPQQIQPEELSDEVKEFLQGETDELPEGAEEISNEEAAELEKQVKNADKCLYFNGKKINRECKKDDCKCYLLSSLDCDDYTEVSEEEKERVNSDEEAADPEASVSSEEENQPEAEPIEEQKKYVKEKERILNDIKELEEKNIVLETEAEKFENLASTMDTEPFVELKSLVKETIKTYTDRNDIKEVKKKIKNFEAIVSMENLLNEYKDLADENRQNIVANNNDIKNYKNRLEEVEGKITCFQTKLGLGDSTDDTKEE